MMPLDSHLFSDLKKAIQRHVMLTAERDCSRFKMGTPEELSDALIHTWISHPEIYRIKELSCGRNVQHHSGQHLMHPSLRRTLWRLLLCCRAREVRTKLLGNRYGGVWVTGIHLPQPPLVAVACDGRTCALSINCRSI